MLDLNELAKLIVMFVRIVGNSVAAAVFGDVLVLYSDSTR
jgi:hypothetical protein